MMEFIKKNKMFVAVLTFIFVVMAAVAVYALSINKPSDIVPVSYTHLDVYKRQVFLIG